MSFLGKLRNLSTFQKKLIIWTVAILLSVALISWWLFNTARVLERSKNVNIEIFKNYEEFNSKYNSIKEELRNINESKDQFLKELSNVLESEKTATSSEDLINRNVEEINEEIDVDKDIENNF
jgi:biopolymer transport protein ExbB/TolQ